MIFLVIKVVPPFPQERVSFRSERDFLVISRFNFLLQIYSSAEYSVQISIVFA